VSRSRRVIQFSIMYKKAGKTLRKEKNQPAKNITPS
jgi:hypothetical protein